MITMYYVLWATKAKEDYIGTYTSRAAAVFVAESLDLDSYHIEEKGLNDSLTISVRPTKI
jgi:hypothetical protein